MKLEIVNPGWCVQKASNNKNVYNLGVRTESLKTSI